MVSENTRKICSFLLYWLIKNNIKDILIDKVLPNFMRQFFQSPSFRGLRILVLLLLTGHSYYFFLKTGFHYMLFCGSVMYILQSLPMPHFIVYNLHKSSMFKNISYVEFREIAKAFKAFDVTNDEVDLDWQNDFLVTLNAIEQSILLRLGADLEDLPLFEKNPLYAFLKKHSLQSMAMKAFVKTEKPFPFPFLPSLKLAHDIAKQQTVLENTPIDIEEEFIDTQRLRL